MNKTLLTRISILAAATALVACGGGGGDPAPAGSGSNGTVGTVSQPQNTGAVTAAFNTANASSRYALVGVGTTTFGALTSLTQDASSGAVTQVGSYAHSGTGAVTHEIAGDADFAQGRWIGGQVAGGSSGTTTLSGADSDSFHYFVLKNFSALPTTGTMTCDAGKFTAPTVISGSVASNQYAGATTGSATVLITSAGVKPTVNLQVSTTGAPATVSGSPTLTDTASFGFTGSYLSGSTGQGTAITVGRWGTSGMLVGVLYKTQLPNGGIYQGVATFRCS